MPYQESKKRRLAWAFLALLSVVALGWSVYSGIERRQYVDCNAKQVDLIIQYLDAVTTASQEERVATDEVRRAQRDGDMEKARRAIDEYFKTRAEADARRASAPLPPLPETVCGRARA